MCRLLANLEGNLFSLKRPFSCRPIRARHQIARFSLVQAPPSWGRYKTSCGTVEKSWKNQKVIIWDFVELKRTVIENWIYYNVFPSQLFFILFQERVKSRNLLVFNPTIWYFVKSYWSFNIIVFANYFEGKCPPWEQCRVCLGWRQCAWVWVMSGECQTSASVSTPLIIHK